VIRIAILLLLIVFWSASACAAIYQCRTRDGKLFLTNNRDKFPPGCEQVGGPVGEEPASSQPAGSPPSRESGRRTDNLRQTSPLLPSQMPPAPDQPTRSDAPSPYPAAPETDIEKAKPGAPEDQSPQQPNSPADERSEAIRKPPGEPDQPNALAPSEGGETLPANGADTTTPKADQESWLAEARALASQYDALSNATDAPPGQAERLDQMEIRIQSFLDRLEASGLSEEEQAEVEAELPPAR